MSIYYPAGKNSYQPLVDSKNYILNVLEDYDTKDLLSVVRPPINQEYYSLNYAEIYYKGYGYPDSTTLSIDSPSLSDGTQAACSPSFGLSIYSLNISEPNHQSGDVYYIYPSNNIVDINNFAVISIVLVDDDGYVKTYEVIESGSNFNNSSSIICYKNSKSTADEDGNFGVDDMELSHNISLINDKFCISKIIIENEGSGYARYDSSRKTIEYKIATNSYNIGNGFYGTLKSKNYFALENTGAMITRALDRNRSNFIDKYGKLIINASSTPREKTLYDKIFYNPIKTTQALSFQKHIKYSFDDKKHQWISLETIPDFSSSSEDKCSTFGDGFTYATIALAGGSFDRFGEPNCQLINMHEVNREILKGSIKRSMDRVIHPKKILEILRSVLPNAKDPTAFFHPEVIKSIGLTVANDMKQFLVDIGKLDYKSFGFCNLKEMDDFVKSSIAAELNSVEMRRRFSGSMAELLRKTLRRGQSIFGFSYPLSNYNPEIVRMEIERRLYRLNGSWQKIINIVSGEVGSALGYSNGYGGIILDPYDDPLNFTPRKVKPKVKTNLLKALRDNLSGLARRGVLKAKCVNGKTVLKTAGKAAKILAVYILIQELAHAQDGWDVSDAVGNFVSPLPPEWFTGEGEVQFIDLSKISQQDIDTLQNQITNLIARYTVNPNPEAFRAELALILNNFVPKTLDDFDQPISEEQLNQILQNIIDDADSIKDQIGDDAALEDLNVNIEELKRQLDFYDAANKHMEKAFMDVFGSDDICDCPGAFEEKTKEFNEKAQQILEDYLQYNENLRQKGPMTEEEWKKEEKKFLGASSFSLFENGLPTISIMRMPLDSNNNPIMPNPKNLENEKFFNKLDMYKIQ